MDEALRLMQEHWWVKHELLKSFSGRRIRSYANQLISAAAHINRSLQLHRFSFRQNALQKSFISQTGTHLIVPYIYTTHLLQTLGRPLLWSSVHTYKTKDNDQSTTKPIANQHREAFEQLLIFAVIPVQKVNNDWTRSANHKSLLQHAESPTRQLMAHIVRMEEGSSAFKILTDEATGKITLGRPRHR